MIIGISKSSVEKENNLLVLLGCFRQFVSFRFRIFLCSAFQVTSISWNGNELNMVDTPGHADFGGEVCRPLNHPILL